MRELVCKDCGASAASVIEKGCCQADSTNDECPVLLGVKEAEPSKAEKLPLCAGCTDNFYNGRNNLGVTECWSLALTVLIYTETK